MKKQFREMHDRMDHYMKQQSVNPATTKEQQTNPAQKKPGEDYIDFEEVK